jgi:hypothetical protein
MHAKLASRSLNAGVAMQRCEANRIDYVFGLARNSRLEAALVEQLAPASACARVRASPCGYSRRVIGKAEHTLDESNPRFVVTSLKRTRGAYDARSLYGDLYCARGEVENRTGEMFADRASSATMSAPPVAKWRDAPPGAVMTPQCGSGSYPPSRQAGQQDRKGSTPGSPGTTAADCSPA